MGAGCNRPVFPPLSDWFLNRLPKTLGLHRSDERCFRRSEESAFVLSRSGKGRFHTSPEMAASKPFFSNL